MPAKQSPRAAFTEEIENILDLIDYWYETRGEKPIHNASATADKGHTISNTTLYASFGAPGSGKTYAINKVLEEIKPHIVVFINPNLNLDQTIDLDTLPTKYLLRYTNIKEGLKKVVEYLWYRLKRISNAEEYQELLNKMNDRSVIMNPKDINRQLEKLAKEQLFFDSISPDDDFWDVQKLVTVIFDDCGSKRKDMECIQDALESVLVSRRHLALRCLMNLQGLTQVPLKIRRLISDVNINPTVSSDDRYRIMKQYRDNLIPELYLQPKEMKALLAKLSEKDPFTTFQFFHGGFTCNFEPVSKDEALQAIQEFYEDERKKKSRVLSRKIVPQ